VVGEWVVVEPVAGAEVEVEPVVVETDAVGAVVVEAVVVETFVGLAVCAEFDVATARRGSELFDG
jgi:hypothetical protein